MKKNDTNSFSEEDAKNGYKSSNLYPPKMCEIWPLDEQSEVIKERPERRRPYDNPEME